MLSATGLAVAEGDAEGSSYTVKLVTKPLGEVSVTISGYAGTDLTLDKTTLTFTTTNWNAAQTVTVTAAEDDDGVSDVAMLTHTASGGDYAGIIKDLPVTVDDDEAVTFDPDTVTRVIDENTRANQIVGSPVTAVYTGTGMLIYTLGGADAASFEIDSSTGQIRTKTGVTYDHEARSFYSVTVTASDGNGRTDEATVTINVNDANEPPRVPEGVIAHAVPRTYDQIFVRWTAPGNTGRPDITGYDIRYNGGYWRDGPQNVVGTSATISGLEDGKYYYVQVRAKNDEGNGPWSEKYPTYTNILHFDVETDVSIVPDGLVPGDEFHLLFVTPPERALRRDMENYINAAANPVITLPQSNEFQGYWQFFSPVVSTRHIDARTITNTTYTGEDKGAPIYWVGGGKVADDYEDFYDGDWDDYSARNASGELVSLSDGVWTGSMADGRELMDGGTSRALGQSQAGYGAPGSSVPGEGPLYSGSTAANTEMKPILSMSSVFLVVHPPLVTNVSQTRDTGDDRSARRFQTFTTRSNRYGYEFSGVAIGKYFRETSHIEVSIYSVNANGHPDTELFALGNPDSYTNNTQAFNAPAGATLDPGVTYAVVVQHATSGANLNLDTTASDSEDYESLDGWSIADAFHYESGGRWQADADGRALKIIVRGIAKVGVSLAPTDFTATAVGLNRIDLSWTAPTDDGGSAITGYRIESSDDGVTGWADLAPDTGSADTTYSNTGILHNTTRHYRVSAINGEGTSEPSDAADATTDDYPKVTVQFGADSYTVAEGETRSVTVTLSEDPLQTTVIQITATGQGGAVATDYAVPVPFSVTFNSGDTSKSFDFTAAQDDVDDDNESVKLKFGANLPPKVSTGRMDETTVSITDDDTAGVAIEPTALSVVAGRSNEYTVRLATEPTGEVSVTISGHAATDVTLNSDTLTFTVGNWSMAQTVTVSAAQGAATGRVTLAHAVSGADYGSITADPVVVSVVGVAAQQPPVQVGVSSLTQTLTVPEGGSNSYTVVLGSRPTGDVSIGVTLPAGTDLTLSSDTLTFTTGDWDVGQTVTVTAAEDDDAATDDVATLTHTVSGGGYTSTTVPDVEVSITENDTPGLVISKDNLAVVEGDAGGTSYTVALATKPSAGVSVSVTGHTGTDLSLDKTTLTFTTGNWNTTQTVTVKAGEDDDGITDTATLTHTASGGDYSSVTKDLPVTVTENDTADVVLSETRLTVTEGDAAGSSYTVALATKPSAGVSVSVTGHTGTDLSLDKTTLTFTTGNWNTAQTVTVKAGQDDDTVSDAATLRHTASGGDYAGVTADLPVTVTDAGDPHVTVQFGAGAYTVSEGSTTTITVTLSADPKRTVVIPFVETILGNTTSADYSVQPSVTFNSGETSQTFEFTAVQDDVDDDDESMKLAFGTIPDARVSAGPTRETTVSITDDDTAGVAIEPTALSVLASRSNEYAVRLDTQPTGEVSVTISGHASTDVTLDKTELTFTVGNWDDAQTVTVSAAENAATGRVTLAHAVSGADYGSITADPVVVSVVGVAGQRPTIQVGVDSLTQTLTVPEGGSNSYTVVLGSRPTGDVSVSITGQAGTDLTLSSDTLTFTTGDWDVGQTVTVTAAEDDDAATDDVATLTHTVSGGGYTSTTVPDVEVSITENDTPGLVISKDNLAVVEGDAGGTSYTVALATKPSAGVSVSVTGHTGTDLSLDKTTLTFTTGNWNTTQTVTVKAGEDDDGITDTATLTHTASGGDYSSVTKDLPVTVTENDTADVVLSETRLTVTEGDAAGSSYTVALATKPSAGVSVSVTGHTGTDLSLDKTTLTFTTGNWNTAQTVTVKAGQDDDTVSDAATLRHTASGGDYAGVTADLPVTVTDAGDPHVTVQFGAGAYTVSEGSTTTITVTLSADPKRTVVIPFVETILGNTTSADYSVQPSVTFNSGETSQTFEFTAVQDDVDDDDESMKLAFGTIPDARVSAGPTRETTVSITDDDTAGVAIEPTALSVLASRSNEYAVRLDTQPTGEVSVTISGHASTDVTLDKTELTFTVGNWDDAQTVTVSAAENAATGRVTLAHAVSGADYGSITADPVVVSVVGVAGQRPTIQVGVDSLTQTLTVPEGGSNSYTVVLGSRPTGDVSVSITGQAGTDLTLSSDTLTFTTGDWDVGQTVTVTAAEDDDAATDDVATLTHTVSGGGYTSTTVPDVEVSITENDTPGLVISKDNLAVVEGDAGGTSYTVALATKPSAGVSVSVTGHTGTDLSLDKTTLTFTTGNWNTAQTVTVKAGQDDDTVSDAATLRHTASGGDYAGVTADLPVTVTDAGDPHVTVQFGAGAYTVSEGSTTTITVTLSADPKRTVVIPFVETILGNTTSADYSVQPSVTFNSGETSQTFEFMAMADDASDDGESVMIGFGTNLPSRVTKGTPEETMVSIRQMNPQLGSGVTVQFEADAYTVAEGGTQSVTVTLSADPQSTVVIPITATNQGGATSSDYSIVSSSVTFNSGDTSQTITFSATEDMEDELGESVLLAFGPSIPSGVSAGTPSQTTVSIIDGCDDGDIWCATLNFSMGSFDSSERLNVNQIDTEDFLYDSVDYQLIDIRVIQNGHHGGDDVNVQLPFGIPERTKWSMDFRNLNSGTGSEQFEILTEDWRDWTLHVSTVSGGDTLTAALRFSEASYTGQAWWWWFGRDIDHMRRVWQPGQLYKVRLIEDPRSERPPQPLNPPMYLRV